MEAETACVCAESSIVLNTVADVGANFTLIVYPGHAESEDAVWFDKTFDNLGFLELGVFVVNFFNRGQNLFNSLQILAFAWMLSFQVGHNLFYFHDIE